MNQIQMYMNEIENHEIHYLEAGNGQKILLFHGSGCGALEWKTMMEESTEYHFIAPDLSWYGRNAFEPVLKETRNFDLKIVETFIKEHSPCHLVGHSYGASLLLESLKTNQSEILSLTLIEPLSFELIRTSDPKGYAEACEFVSKLWDHREKGKNQAGAKEFLKYWAYSLAWNVMNKAQKNYLEDRFEKITEEFSSFFEASEDLSFCNGLTYPVYLIQGQWTRRSTASVIAALENAFKTEAVIIPGSGHLSPITQARLVANVIQGNVLARAQSISNYSL